LKRGDTVEVIAEESDYYHRRGTMEFVDEKGRVVVIFDDGHLEAFRPFDLELCVGHLA
jgi:hypothetical protein